MKVKSAPGTRCPMENKPRAYIMDDKFVTVPATTYYRRLVLRGSLIEAETAKKAAPKPAAGKAKGGER